MADLKGRGRARGLTCALSLVLGAALHGSPSQDPPQEPRRWKFFEPEIEFATLLDFCSQALGAHIEFDPAKASGVVKVQVGPGYTEDELWESANRELFVRGLASVQPPESDFFRIVAVVDAANLARLEAVNLAGARAGYVKVLVPLAHRSAEKVLETIRLMLSKPGGTLSAVQGESELVIADYRAHVAQALAVIAALDRPLREPLVQEFDLVDGTPTALAALVERILQTREQVVGEALQGSLIALPEAGSVLVVAPISEMPWWKEMVERFDRPEPVTTVHYTPRRFGLAETARLIEEVVRGDEADAAASWKLVVDELTGSLVVTTTLSKHREIEKLFDRFESVAEGPRRPLRAFPIHHRQVKEVLQLLQGLVAAGVLETEEQAEAGKDATAAVQGATAPIQSPRPAPASGELAPPITLAADEGANRILAFGEARLLDQVERLIETLDTRQSEVLVEALVVTLTDTETRDLGVELQKIGTSDGALYQAASLFGLGSTSPTFGSLPAAGGTGFSGAVLDPGSFSAIVRALETLNKGRSLTVPKVLVNNNQEATLDSTLQTPYASTNASTTVATTSFGGTFDAGTAIVVKPQVADGDQIVIEYTISLSSFVGQAADPALPPPRQENRLQSVVTIPDGYTVVVGGLEVQSDTRGKSRVPGLGGLPILGALFSDRTRTKSRNRFFVFLRCSVMRSENFEDLRYTSAPALTAAGVDDGWPELEPRVIR